VLKRRFEVSLLFAILVSILSARSAGAADDEPAEAKAHYNKATAHFAVGEYKEAAAEYEAAFKIHQHPALLYNAAQSHRLAGDNQKALILYKNLVKLYPSTKYAADSKERIQKLEQAIASSQSPPNGPASIEGAGGTAPAPVGDTPTSMRPAPAPVPTLASPPAATGAPSGPAASLVAAPASPAEQQPPIYKKWWFWAGAGAVVVVAVVVAVAASSSTTPWANLPDVHGSLAGVRW
jgi:tetratricopeptide (TPR) repeat protein